MYLGLDLGTSGLKGILVDAGQRTVASANAPLSVSRPADGWSEQDPALWIGACDTVMSALHKANPQALGELKAIGLSGQMHGATLLGADDAPLRPCILWNDTRSHEGAALLDADQRFRALTGNIVFPGFTAPKIAWVRNHEPGIAERITKVLLPKDYLRLHLTGEHISEMSDAAGTSWLDMARRDWSEELLAATGLARTHMPALVEGSEPGGRLRDNLADAWNVPRGIIVAGGGADNAASAVGMGVMGSGDAFISIGTSGVLLAASNAYSPRAESAVHTFCHAIPSAWYQMGVILAAADALSWYSSVSGVPAPKLTGELGDTLLAPGRCRFLPYLGGERTPHNDSAIRGAFLGLSHADDRPALTRAVLEGVAFAFRDSQEALALAGNRVGRAIAVGGGSLSDYWLKAVATALDIPIDIPEEGDFGGAFGAARLALLADTGAAPAEVCTPPDITRTIAPEASLRAAFEDAYGSYKQAYPALKEA